jgi:hypothetical protein
MLLAWRKQVSAWILQLAVLSFTGHIIIQADDQLCDYLESNELCDSTCMHKLSPAPTVAV